MDEEEFDYTDYEESDLLEDIKQSDFDGVWIATSLIPGEMPVITDIPRLSAFHPTMIAPLDNQEVIQLAKALQKNSTNPHKDSGHFNYSPAERLGIVNNYRKTRAKGKIKNKDAWARTNHGITGRTLKNYENEYPEEDYLVF